MPHQTVEARAALAMAGDRRLKANTGLAIHQNGRALFFGGSPRRLTASKRQSAEDGKSIHRST